MVGGCVASDDEERERFRLLSVLLIGVKGNPSPKEFFFNMARRRCSEGWSVQVALFLAVSLFVQPVQPNSAKGRGESVAI